MRITLKIAQEADINLINNTYKKIEFKESDFSNETIIIAEYNNEFVGLGRLQKINAASLEMGGIYVSENNRGIGIADKIVEKLVELSSSYEYVYCIPFKHLGQFYRRFGFNDINKEDNIPEKVVKKHKWCNEFYDEKTLLLVKINKSFT